VPRPNEMSPELAKALEVRATLLNTLRGLTSAERAAYRELTRRGRGRPPSNGPTPAAVRKQEAKSRFRQLEKTHGSTKAFAQVQAEYQDILRNVLHRLCFGD
jgi:hypothetical protein